MVQHTDKLSVMEQVKRTMHGIFLMNCLETTGYLKGDTNMEERVFFSRLALTLYNIILSNNHSVSFLILNMDKNDVDLKT